MKFLLRDGYLRIAPEVFMRTPTRRASEKHYRRLEEVAPKTGIVRVLRITEKQYESIYLLSGEIDYQNELTNKKQGVILINVLTNILFFITIVAQVIHFATVFPIYLTFVVTGL